jgi:hypothetical protein
LEYTSNTSAKPSSTTVAKQDLPFYLISVSEDFWTKAAADQIQESASNKYSVIHAPNSIVEESLTIRNEECVAQAARLYLVYPVMLVLNEKYKNVIKYHPENGTKDDPDDPNRQLRMDFVWTIKRGGEDVTVAILEYKRQGYIRAQEFEDAYKDGRSRRRALKERLHNPEFSYIEGNAAKFVKQVASYATAQQCRYVSLFDWNTFVLMHCDKLREKNVGETVETTTITEPNKFRKALLGFLLKACEHADVPIPSTS